jgi:putative hemolysin
MSGIDDLLLQKKVELQVYKADLANIPSGGSYLVVSNRLFPEIDELILAKIFGERCPDFKIISERNADEIGLPARFFYPVGFAIKLLKKPFGLFSIYLTAVDKALIESNCIGMIVNFSGYQIGKFVGKQRVKKKLKAVRITAKPIIPVRLEVVDRSSLLDRVMTFPAQETRKVIVRIGSVISPEEQKPFEKYFWRFLRSKIFALGTGIEVRKFFELNFLPRPTNQEPIIAPVEQSLIEAEIARLYPADLITSQSNFDVFIVEARRIPNTLTEIGRLREITFRTVGEGTGKSLDLDEYDLYYFQLIIWDREERRIAGGYRIGMGDQIFAKLGVDGFYISSLFKIEEGFFHIMRQAVELGRSYIVPEYQKKRLPLFLLWRGILFFLLKNPEYRYLFGPLSISKHYTKVSRSLIVAFVKRYYFDHELASYLRPRKPFRVKNEKVDISLLVESMPPELDALENFIEDIEPQHLTMPVLLKQYIRQNAKFISFNVDPKFSDVLDGFIILDLKDLPQSTIDTLKQDNR